LKIHRFSFIFRIYYIRVGHFQFRVGKESLKDLISFVFQVEKFVKKNKTKQNKTTRVGGLLAHARTTGSLSNKTEKGYIYSSLRPFLSMSLHFYYFFLFLYTSLILPSYFRCLAMVVVVGRLQPSNTQPSKGHVFFFLFYN
jgi:hypothetical protein